MEVSLHPGQHNTIEDIVLFNAQDTLEASEQVQFITEEVLTPFYYLLSQGWILPEGENYEEGNVASGTANYTSYDLFCFNSKFQSLLRNIREDLSHKLIPITQEGRVVLGIELSWGMYTVPISYDLKRTLDDFVVQSLEKKSKFLFFCPKFDITVDSVQLPSWWLRSIINHVPLPEIIRYNNIEVPTLAEVISSQVYMVLNPNSTYYEDVTNMRLKFLDSLKNLYLKGSLALSPENEVIKKWGLEVIFSGIYACPWKNILVGDHTHFLLDRILGVDYVKIKGTNKKFEEGSWEYTVIGEHTLVKCSNYDDLCRLTKFFYTK